MTQQEIFGRAKWIGAPEASDVAPLFVKKFTIDEGEECRIRLIGLGTFVLYLNGRRVSDDYFLPLNSEYEKTEFPVGEELTGYRVWVTEYDLGEYVRAGENVLAVLVGGGWYTGVHYGIHKIYGEKKLIYSIKAGEREIVSDPTTLTRPSFAVWSDINKGEAHDMRGWSDGYLLGLGEGWEPSREVKAVETEYGFTDCPADYIATTLPVRELLRTEDYVLYDCGSNTSGYPVLTSREGFVGKVEVTFSEGLSADGRDLDEAHVHWQTLSAVTDGTPCEIFPRFTWYGFRYFKVSGDAVCREVKVVHSRVEVSSSFVTNNDTLNWIYNAFVNTQLTNMHRGIPSDCPHIERLGYTGDGQQVCRSALLTLSARSFYEKWIKDISDCQDKLTGRVQYTAPYYFCGGGPGGWGCAIAVVPYEFYKLYGDETYIRELYPQMLRFLDFLEDNSTADVVTNFKDGLWCLGDWCPPTDYTLPTPFVNTYFRVYTTEIVKRIAKIIGREEDIPRLDADIERCKRAINTFYFNSFERDDCYCANVQGAGAYAIGIGLGTEITKEKFIEYYDRLGYYDTGIFATELVTRRLFELGRADVAFRLLTASEPHGFGRWQKLGDTLREYWGERCRSFSHPMFGAVVATFYEYFLGIRQSEDGAGYTDILIAPVTVDGLDTVSGHITVPKGKIAVSYTTVGGVRNYKISLPDGVRATIELPHTERRTVVGGEHEISVRL